MSTLSMKKRRSTLLLRTLSFNIAKSAEQLNLKQCGDLLYSMSTLNFSDENLLSRIANDVCTNLNKNFKISSVVGSIITSVGLLKYKNPGNFVYLIPDLNFYLLSGILYIFVQIFWTPFVNG